MHRMCRRSWANIINGFVLRPRRRSSWLHCHHKTFDDAYVLQQMSKYLFERSLHWIFERHSTLEEQWSVEKREMRDDQTSDQPPNYQTMRAQQWKMNFSFGRPWNAEHCETKIVGILSVCLCVWMCGRHRSSSLERNNKCCAELLFYCPECEKLPFVTFIDVGKQI